MMNPAAPEGTPPRRINEVNTPDSTTLAVFLRRFVAGNTHRNIMMKKEYKNSNPGPEEIAIFRYKEEFSLLMRSNAVAPEEMPPWLDRKENTPDRP